MVKKITKISVETTDENGKKEITHLHEGNVKSFHWKKFAEGMGAVMTGIPPI